MCVSVGVCPRLYGYSYALHEVDHGHGQLVRHLPPGGGRVEIIIGGGEGGGKLNTVAQQHQLYLLSMSSNMR